MNLVTLKKSYPRWHTNIDCKGDNLLKFYRIQLSVLEMLTKDCIETKSRIPSVVPPFQLWSIGYKNQLMFIVALKGKHKIATIIEILKSTLSLKESILSSNKKTKQAMSKAKVKGDGDIKWLKYMILSLGQKMKT